MVCVCEKEGWSVCLRVTAVRRLLKTFKKNKVFPWAPAVNAALLYCSLSKHWFISKLIK